MDRVVFLLFVSLVGMAQCGIAAQFHYVRADATGDGSGRDWTNAYRQLPVTLPSIGYPNPPRYQLFSGDTYYIADGDYPAYTFDTPPLNGQIITIKKATLTDHGTEGGWTDAFGDGQAVFGKFSFEASNYVIDGQKRNEEDWFDASSYGFSVGKETEEVQIHIFNYGRIPSNITIKNVYVPGWSAPLPTVTRSIAAIYVHDNDGGTTSHGLLFHRMYVSGSNNVWFLRCTEGAIVEYSASQGAKSNSENHGEIVNLYYSGENAVIRYNKFRDAYVDAGGTALVAIVYAGGLQFYGNEARNFRVGDASVGYDGTPHGNGSSNNRVYNNTFVDCLGAGGTRWGTGTNNKTFNNIWFKCAAFIEGSHDYNAKFPIGTSYTDSVKTEPHAQQNISEETFMNYSRFDYRLAAATDRGDPDFLNSSNYDLFGQLRGKDGNWDRGAYEFCANGCPPAQSNPSDEHVAEPSDSSDLILDRAVIDLSLGQSVKISATDMEAVRIFDRDGELVAPLVISVQEGKRTGSWNGKNYRGFAVASGTYMIDVQTSQRSLRKKIVVIK